MKKVGSLLVVATLTLGGCDTLRARQVAGDAAVLYKKGDLRGAAAKYEEAAKLDPGIATIHLNLGFTYLSLFSSSPKSKEGNDAGGRAIQEFESYIVQKPGDERGRQYLVQTFVDTNRYNDAVAYFKPEVDRTPPVLEAVTTLGLIASKTGRIDDALTWYERRIELNPNDPDARYNLGVLIWDHLHSHVALVGDARLRLADRGLESLKQAREMRPHGADAYTYTNLLYRERAAGEPDLPHADYDTAQANRFQQMSMALMKNQPLPVIPEPPLPPPFVAPVDGVAPTTPPGAPGQPPRPPVAPAAAKGAGGK